MRHAHPPRTDGLLADPSCADARGSLLTSVVAAYGEIRRVLAPGGRAVLTCWEPLDWDDERLPERLRRVALGAGLTAAGFGDVEVFDRPGWRACERAMWEEAVALDPGDDPALRSFHDEGVRSLEIFGLVRRVIATQN